MRQPTNRPKPFFIVVLFLQGGTNKAAKKQIETIFF
jgi:hypothetical protein